MSPATAASPHRPVSFINVVGCGTASYAAHVAAYLIQDWVGLPASMQVGSEMRYSPPPIEIGRAHV